MSKHSATVASFKAVIGPSVLTMIISSTVNVQAMTEKELCRLYLDVVEHSVEVFEPLWVDDSDRVPASGFFDFRKYNNWKNEEYESAITIPGNGMVAFCYSVLLQQTDKEFFSDRKVPRATLLDHATKAVRWICLTSSYVDRPYPYPIGQSHEGHSHLLMDGHWARRIGSPVDAMGWATLAAAMLWDDLDEETRNLVEQVMIGGAARELNPGAWTIRYKGGGLHDRVKQDLASTIGAAFLFPSRLDGATYQRVVRANGIGMVATEHDKACQTMVDGRPVRDWWPPGWNLYQDYSSDHHGWAQMWYGADMLFEGRSYVQILSALTGVPVPESFRYDGNGFDGVAEWIKTLYLPEGEPASVHGVEYDSYYGAGLLGYCYGALVRKDPVAARFEEHAASLLQRHSRAIGEYDYHRNSWAKAATAFLMHKYLGPRVEPAPYEEALRSLDGTYHYQWQQSLIHRSPDKWASFSWGSISSRERPRPVGLVVPARPDIESLEPLVYLHEYSLSGTVELKDAEGEFIELKRRYPQSLYRFARTDAGMSTTGVVSDPWLDRYYSFFSLDDGPCILLTSFRARKACSLSWSGLPVYFYVRDGMTSPMRLHDAEGDHPLAEQAERTSLWWCVDDRLGMVVAGGNSRLRVERSVGYNWARTSEYRDKCDGVFVSPIEEKVLVPGDSAVELAAVICPDTPRGKVAELSCACQGPETQLSLPQGWTGLIVPGEAGEARRHLVVANLYGDQTTATLDLVFAEGAPVCSHSTVIRGKTGSVNLALEGMESVAESVELYAEVLDSGLVRARKLSRHRFLFCPTPEGAASVRLCYFGGKSNSVKVVSEHNSGDSVSAMMLDENNTIVLSVNRPLVIEFRPKDGIDRIAPAVEITDVNVRVDGRLTVEVRADDQSGIHSVELYCDGKRVSRRSARPYIWPIRVKAGMHTFHAVAVDDSPQRNTRQSFKRTVDVEIRDLP